MKLTGQESIAAPPSAVWAALIDPEVLRRLIPGCETMTGSPEAGYDIAVARTVGSLEVRLTGRVDLTDPRPGESVDLVASGSGGSVGGARGTGRIRLVSEGQGTSLSYDLEAETEGPLTRLPDFVVRMAAGRVAEGFLRRFKAAVEGVEPAPRKGFLGRLVG